MSAISYLVMNMDTGEVLLQKEAHEVRRPASLTKHGLDFREYGPHYSTAHDLALLTRAAYQQPLFAEVARARTWEAHGLLEGTWHRYPMRNMNELLWRYAGAEGVKIGYTRQAKQTLIAVAARDGRRLIAVVLGSTQRAVDGARLLDEGFGMRVKGTVALTPGPSPNAGRGEGTATGSPPTPPCEGGGVRIGRRTSPGGVGG